MTASLPRMTLQHHAFAGWAIAVKSGYDHQSYNQRS
jgi:hypothetical protein